MPGLSGFRCYSHQHVERHRAERHRSSPLRREREGLHFAPSAPGCNLSASTTTTAQIAADGAETAAAGAPDYAKMWSDGTLRVYVHFDKADPAVSWDDPNAPADEGVAAFQKHLDWLAKALPGATVTSAPFTPDASKPDVHNVQYQHRATLPDGRAVVVDSTLLNPGYNVGVWAPAPPEGAPIDVAIVNKSPFADYYIDPDASFVIWGSAPSYNLALNVSNARFSYELGKGFSPDPVASPWPKTVQYAGDVPFADQSAITQRVFESLVEGKKTFDALGSSIEAIDPKLMPVIADASRAL